MAHSSRNFSKWIATDSRWRRYLRVTTLALVLMTLSGSVAPALAAFPIDQSQSYGQSEGWVHVDGPSIRYWMQSSDPNAASDFELRYGAIAERALQEIGLLLATTSDKRIKVYGYNNLDQFNQAVATLDRRELADVPTVTEPEDYRIVLYLPQFEAGTDLESENGLRHAISHVLTWQVSGGNIPWGFDEGIAQYVERPTSERLARIAALMQRVMARGIPPSWFDMNRGVAGIDPEELAAQSYSAVAFLIDRYELAYLRDFLAKLNESETWSAAMATAYGRDAGTIEGLARDSLPSWVASGWRTNIVAAFDLSRARKLLDQANYAAAKSALDPSQALYRQLDDPTQQEVIDELLSQCDIGIQAESLMTQAQQALELHTYERAVSLIKQARSQYAQLPPEQTPTMLLDTYDALATDGIAAGEQLDQAEQLASSWLDYRDAEMSAALAGSTFARLGDAENKARADETVALLDGRQRRIVLLLGALAVLTLAWLALWLWARGRSELDWN